MGEHTDLENRDKYAATNIFRALKETRWENIQAEASQPVSGRAIVIVRATGAIGYRRRIKSIVEIN